MSDRLQAVVKEVIDRLRVNRAAANALPAGPERNRFIACHKILVFSKYLAALDLIDIALEQRRVKTMRFDGTVSMTARDELRKEFEESGKV